MYRIWVRFSVAVVVLLGLLAGGRAAGTTAQDGAGEGVVGSWRVAATEDGQTLPTLVTFHADGTLTGAEVPVAAAAPGSPLGALVFSGTHGAWEATGDGVAYTFDTLAAGVNGTLAGRATTRGTLRLGADGATFSGPFTYTVADEAGNEIFSGGGTAEGTRIVVEPMGTPVAASPGAGTPAP